MDEVVELTLCQIPACFAFKLPLRTRAEGWLAAEMTEQMWAGKLRIAQRGDKAAILLTNKDDGKLFAMSPLEEGSVDRVKDSSRYFVLKIQNAQGRHAFIGLAFNDRNHAFDFNVAMQEFQKEREREKEVAKVSASGGEAQGPTIDYSLKKGEKIKINVAGSSNRRQREKQGGGRVSGGLGGGGGLLAPPPGDTPGTAKRPGLLAPPPADTAPVRSASAIPGAGGDDLDPFAPSGGALGDSWGALTPSPQLPPPSAAQPQSNMAGMSMPISAPAPANDDPFADYNF